MDLDERRRAVRLAIPALKHTMETRWRPMWKGMGTSEVASQVMARSGPAVDDPAWGPHKIAEAELWVREELVREEKEKRIAKRRATVSFRLSLAAFVIALAAAAFTAGNLYLTWSRPPVSHHLNGR